MVGREMTGRGGDLHSGATNGMVGRAVSYTAGPRTAWSGGRWLAQRGHATHAARACNEPFT
eukprot:363958-Chlamydomonas_euryale.AAC.5